MTERKPQEVSFASWVDQQIAEAADRGAFDDLPGAGKPIPRRGGTEAWLQDYLRREGVSADELLPTPLRLRKEVERLAETVGDLRSEDEVREVVRGLNRRILEWRRIPTGPPIYLRLAGEEAMVARWRDAQPGPPAPAPAARPPRDTSSPRRRRWRRRALRPGVPGRACRCDVPQRRPAGRAPWPAPGHRGCIAGASAMTSKKSGGSSAASPVLWSRERGHPGADGVELRDRVAGRPGRGHGGGRVGQPGDQPAGLGRGQCRQRTEY